MGDFSIRIGDRAFRLEDAAQISVREDGITEYLWVRPYDPWMDWLDLQRMLRTTKPVEGHLDLKIVKLRDVAGEPITIDFFRTLAIEDL